MEVMFTNGVDYETGQPLWDGVPFDEFLTTFRDRLPYPREDDERRRATTTALAATRARRAAIVPNPNDPLEVGYGVISSPAGAALLDGPLAPLVALRQVKPEHRLAFDFSQMGIAGLSDWIDDEITFKDGPDYWLLVGNPVEMPFDLQWMLDAGKATGRIEFASDAEYAAYADRIVRAEQALTASAGPPPVFFWSPQHDKMTRLSNWYMCDPLVKKLRSDGLAVTYREESDATVEAFWTMASGWGPRGGLVYTASHGAAVSKSHPDQAALQGCLQDVDGQYITGAGVTKVASAFTNSVVFNFACYSGGTPSHSDFNHWVPQYRMDRYIPDRAFISALHRELLAHPAGPLVAIGHVEPAWAYGFTNPNDANDVVRDPKLDADWGERMRPFRTFVDRIAGGGTVGYAMEMFGYLYDRLGNQIAGRINRFLRDGQTTTDLGEELRRMAIQWVSRNDYQNYVVFGDPAVRVA
ncbi:MAG: hypothetical protein A2Z07_10270 [Armatimonadetes bacterium RBG_16_67_12]|nr:MAG: hypothetical protein A2Z07_10270 [Armatimonadetes bacterium RBG_16_67_12]